METPKISVQHNPFRRLSVNMIFLIRDVHFIKSWNVKYHNPQQRSAWIRKRQDIGTKTNSKQKKLTKTWSAVFSITIKLMVEHLGKIIFCINREHDISYTISSKIRMYAIMHPKTSRCWKKSLTKHKNTKNNLTTSIFCYYQTHGSLFH